MTHPPEPSEIALEADLGSVTDVEWLEGHDRLTQLLAGTDFPAEELTFIWDPDLNPQTLIDSAEVDHGPEPEVLFNYVPTDADRGLTDDTP